MTSSTPADGEPGPDQVGGQERHADRDRVGDREEAHVVDEDADR